MKIERKAHWKTKLFSFPLHALAIIITIVVLYTVNNKEAVVTTFFISEVIAVIASAVIEKKVYNSYGLDIPKTIVRRLDEVPEDERN